jgi:hypothetical protein
MSFCALLQQPLEVSKQPRPQHHAPSVRQVPTRVITIFPPTAFTVRTKSHALRDRWAFAR